MLIIGIDAHKRSHAVVIVDEQGRQLAARTVGATTADQLALLGWGQSITVSNWSGRLRTVGTSPVDSSAIYLLQVNESSECRRS
jgi:hypothetical protein